MRNLINIIEQAEAESLAKTPLMESQDDDTFEVSIECNLEESDDLEVADEDGEEIDEAARRLKDLQEQYANFMTGDQLDEAHSPAGKGHVVDMQTIIDVWKADHNVDTENLTPAQQNWLSKYRDLFHAFDASSYHSNTHARGTHGVTGALTDAFQNWLVANPELPNYAPEDLLEMDILDAEQRAVLEAVEALWKASHR